MRKLMMLLSLIPLAAIASPSDQDAKQCDGQHHHMKHHQKGDVPFYLRDMDLSDTQTAQIKALMEKRHADRQAHKGEYWQNKQAIHDLTQAATLDEAELEKLVDKSMAMKKQAAMARARFHHDMFNLLTAEQQDKLQAKMAEFRKKHQH